MKIAIYHENGELASVYEGIENPKINGQDLYFDGGSFSSIDDNHILLNDDVKVPDTLTDEIKALDKKAALEKFLTAEEEKEQLKAKLEEVQKQNDMNALAIMELAQIVFGGW
jgi:hypothetical protein